MTNGIVPAARKLLSKRRLVLLASVAAIGGAVLLAGPGGYQPFALNGTPARAVEAVQPRAGFADLIERVKPAVISVRVKIEQGADTAGPGSDMQQFGGNSPLEKFFRQFGMPDMPDMPNDAARPADDHRRGLGLLHLG